MAKKDNKEKKLDLSFEDAIKNLTEIVAKIESGQTPLEESIAQYERGMGLIRHCRGILESAERKIEKISAQESGPEEAQESGSEDDQDTEELF